MTRRVGRLGEWEVQEGLVALSHCLHDTGWVTPAIWVWGLGFGVWGWSPGFTVYDSGCVVWGLGLVLGFEIWVWGLKLRVECLGLEVWGSGFRIWV